MDLCDKIQVDLKGFHRFFIRSINENKDLCLNIAQQDQKITRTSQIFTHFLS